MKRYGQPTPPLYDLSLLDFPIATMSGSLDKLADPEDVVWTVKQMQKNIVFDHSYYLGHLGFAVAKEMSWWTVDAMAIINHFNNKCDASTLESNFQAGNEKCY